MVSNPHLFWPLESENIKTAISIKQYFVLFIISAKV